MMHRIDQDWYNLFHSINASQKSKSEREKTKAEKNATNTQGKPH